MSFPRYPEYKDSGVEWLGAVPVHWEVKRLKYLGEALIGLTYDPTEIVEEGNGTLVLRSSNVQRRKIVFDDNVYVSKSIPERLVTQLGDILICSRNGSRALIGKNAVIDEQAAGLTFGAFMTIFRSKHSAYLTQVLNSQLFEYQSGAFLTSTINQLTVGVLNNFEIPMPPSSERSQIATFLDREIAKIDALVAEQRRLMALLKEKRRAIISHAVTRGLNPDAPMKPSGIEWLGDVPEHWEVCSIRRVVTAIEQGWSPECFSRPAEDEEWGVLKAGCVNHGIYDQSDNKALPMELAPIPEYEVQVGNVLMSRASGSPELVGSTALVTSTREKLMLSDKIFRLRFDQRIEPKFFVAALNSRPLRSQIEQALSGGNGLANNLPQASLRGFFLAVPPKPEQRAVCEYLESELAKFDTLTTEAQRAIELLQERRTALISAAVTGRIDVRLK